jgi:hypothetical protein
MVHGSLREIPGGDLFDLIVTFDAFGATYLMTGPTVSNESEVVPGPLRVRDQLSWRLNVIVDFLEVIYINTASSAAPPRSTVLEDAKYEPMTVATFGVGSQIR